jgi:hypothetical protein
MRFVCITAQLFYPPFLRCLLISRALVVVYVFMKFVLHTSELFLFSQLFPQST